MNIHDQKTGKAQKAEFISLIALLISLTALTTDVMLPALPIIGRALNVVRENDTQFIISLFFLGFAVGQLIFGPVSDAIGRKPTINIGLVIFAIGCLLSFFAWDYSTMLLGRVLQGLGAAAPRTVTIAVVRDRYEGRSMAQIMSFVMAVFIIVPALAPSIGQVILIIADWRSIFGFLVGLGTIGAIWMWFRLPETLPASARHPLSLRRIGADMLEACKNPVAFGYTIAAGVVFGAFFGYLNSAQQIFHDVFNLGDLFPIFFGALALSIGLASVINAKLVMRLGMRNISLVATVVLSLISAIFLLYCYTLPTAPPIWLFMTWGSISFFCIGLLFGNLNALAMEPLGHIAGTAAAVIGSISTFIALGSGFIIGQYFDGTVIPLVSGFAVLGLLSFFVMVITNRRPEN